MSIITPGHHVGLSPTLRLKVIARVKADKKAYRLTWPLHTLDLGQSSAVIC